MTERAEAQSTMAVTWAHVIEENPKSNELKVLGQTAPSRSAGYAVSTGSVATFVQSSRVVSAYYCMAPKQIEVGRQIERLKVVASDAREQDGLPRCSRESYLTSVSILNALAMTPIPVPVAASGGEGEATLFLDEDGFYGDMEVSGSKIEYYLKYDIGSGVREIAESEEVSDGRVPPILLGHLFCKFAKN